MVDPLVPILQKETETGGHGFLILLTASVSGGTGQRGWLFPQERGRREVGRLGAQHPYQGRHPRFLGRKLFVALKHW